MNTGNTQRAAQWLFDEHANRRRFAPLAGDLLPADMVSAYDVQDALVALRCQASNCGVAGYKVALTTPAMRKFVGYENSIAGQVLANNVIAGSAQVSLAAYGRLGFECELAFLMGADLAPRAAPIDRAQVDRAIAAVAPAFELIDDRHADYAIFSSNDSAALSLAADNAWNGGIVLGPWRDAWAKVDLAAVHGVLRVNGEPAGEGWGRDVLGHPLDAMVWTARHLHTRGLTLKKDQVVITGSLITSKFPKAGDRIRFDAAGVGVVAMDIVP